MLKLAAQNDDLADWCEAAEDRNRRITCFMARGRNAENCSGRVHMRCQRWSSEAVVFEMSSTGAYAISGVAPPTPDTITCRA